MNISSNETEHLDSILKKINDKRVNTSNGLKLCPFCGHEARVIKRSSIVARQMKRSSTVLIECTHCYAHSRAFEINSQFPSAVAEANATTAWNHRAYNNELQLTALPDFEPVDDAYTGDPENYVSPFKEGIKVAKKCPFCGGTPQIQESTPFKEGKFGSFIYCGKCRARTPIFVHTLPKGEKHYTVTSTVNALNYWNRRAYREKDNNTSVL